SDRWEKGFLHLRKFSEREGHSRVPDEYSTDDGYQLGTWVGEQRGNKDRGKLDAQRQQRLEKLPGWSWTVLSEPWDDGFSRLKEFSDREGHSQVPAGYKTDDGFRLGGWVTKQRVRMDKMDATRRRRLEELPGWSWDPFSDRWERGFSRLKS